MRGQCPLDGAQSRDRRSRRRLLTGLYRRVERAVANPFEENALRLFVDAQYRRHRTTRAPQQPQHVTFDAQQVEGLTSGQKAEELLLDHDLVTAFGLDAPDLVVVGLDRANGGPPRQQGRHPVPQIRRNLRV